LRATPKVFVQGDLLYLDRDTDGRCAASDAFPIPKSLFGLVKKSEINSDRDGMLLLSSAPGNASHMPLPRDAAPAVFHER
jgi:hypothetical protein